MGGIEEGVGEEGGKVMEKRGNRRDRRMEDGWKEKKMNHGGGKRIEKAWRRTREGVGKRGTTGGVGGK